MRLLLLLSALLSAMSLGGVRAGAQPVVVASVAGSATAAPTVAIVRRAVQFLALAVPARLSLGVRSTWPMPFAAIIARRLFAERRRE